VRGNRFLHLIARQLGERRRGWYGAQRLSANDSSTVPSKSGVSDICVAARCVEAWLTKVVTSIRVDLPWSEITIAGRQGRFAHVQDLAVVLELRRVQGSLIHPEVARAEFPVGIVDLAPAWDRRGARDVVLPVVHERHHVGEIAFGPARRRHGGK